jgi:hypothetical protein
MGSTCQILEKMLVYLSYKLWEILGRSVISVQWKSGMGSDDVTIFASSRTTGLQDWEKNPRCTRLVPGLFVPEDLPDLFFQAGHLGGGIVPEDRILDAEIPVRENIAEPGNLLFSPCRGTVP